MTSELHAAAGCYVHFRAIDFGELLSAETRSRHTHTSYDLIANIVHDGEPGAGRGTYRVHILHKVLTVSALCVCVCVVSSIVNDDADTLCLTCVESCSW